MAMTMDISLDYGAWAGDDGDTTESRTSRKASPTIYPAGQADQFQQHSTSQRHETQQPSALSLSDPFSDSGESVYDQDLLDAEMNNASSANTSHNLSHPPNTPRGSEGRNFLNSVRIQIYDSPLIDLTESPPQPSLNSSEQSTMPPTLRNHAQSRRPPPASPPSLHTEERSRKRRRLSERSAVAELQEQSTNNEPEIEAVDLTEVNDESDLSKAISKQQQDAVQSQMKDNQGDDTGRTPLSSYKCPICMDTPEDATSTVCGHLFCHKCIIDTLRFSQQLQRRDDARNSRAKGTCPVCRKPLARKDEPGIRRTLVPLEIKLSTRRNLKGKGVVGRNGERQGLGSSVPGRLRAKTERESSADMWRDLTTLEHG